MPVPLWWRDDDAVTRTPALERLSGMAESLGMTVHLAVIPALAEPDLAQAIADTPMLVPMVHGWRHVNHAAAGEKKAEFGAARASAAEELRAGLERLRSLFGPRLLPAFVAPWNRLDPAYYPALAAAGHRAVSTFTARRAPEAAPGLTQINTHIDPIDWRGSRDLAPPEWIIAQTVARLRARRHGTEDSTEPLGYLTHHLIHSEAIWSFSHAFLAEMRAGGAIPVDLTTFLKETP
ncbi:polysaccharide deacetylase family protein [uncultured Roseobacter sp.]|uniref:polysaccharide deacetylase family protein n=1 Tax=uncultured Roseobacter sp. TaxID=114847 RepID=UPI002616AC8C|nr:polysaccharide deacetylase family protein [uncultured Roseobacter sp.]